MTVTGSLLQTGVFLLYGGKCRSLMSCGLILKLNCKTSVYLGLWHRLKILVLLKG